MQMDTFYISYSSVSPWELLPSRLAESSPEGERIPRAFLGADEHAIFDVGIFSTTVYDASNRSIISLLLLLLSF